MAENEIRVLVVGSGVMGSGIARSFAAAGIATGVMSRNPQAVEGLDPAVALLGDLPETAPELIIESVPEVIEFKTELYQRVEARYAGRPVLASNTSGLSLQALADGLAHPERFCGIHYFQPADIAPMVELARVAETTEATMRTAVSLIEASGKMTVILDQPVPGLLINRLQHAILNEAYRLIEAGIATAVDVDRAAKHMLGPRMCVTGLIEQKDLSGIDTHARAQAAIVPHLYHEAEPSRVVMDKLDRNQLGIKTGTGFYDWRQMDVPGYQAWSTGLLTRLIEFIEAERRAPPPAFDDGD